MIGYRIPSIFGLGSAFAGAVVVAWAEDRPKIDLPAVAKQQVDFHKDIQPLFSEFCYSCHGEKKQLSSFRLDKKDSALAGGEIGKSILPGKSIESPLIRYVAGLEEGMQMPPKGKKLSSDQIGLLRAWIDQGAIWPDSSETKDLRKHWAFQTPVRPAVPTPKNPKWVKTPIDAFILDRLEKEGLSASPQAEKTTLIRRLYLDLIGLPPSINEIDEFLADTSKEGYSKIVERLLASPHYGERWGRHWLDAARYADSDGYEKDKSRQMWFYRDYVINALNKDLPYDQFLIEQLAGDLLPNAKQDQIVATGFLRNSMINEEGGVDPEQFRMDAMFDRMEAIGKSILGLTIQCAQCHNHKFDPITQEEYYKLFAFLNNDHESQRVVYTSLEQLKIADLLRQMNEIEKGVQHTLPDWPKRMEEWEASLRQKQIDWKVVSSLENTGDNGQRYIPQKDGSILAQGYAPTKFSTDLKGASPLNKVTGFRLELLNDPNLPCNGPGRSFMGTCALSEFNVDGIDAKDPKKITKIKFIKATADYGNPHRDLEANFDDRSSKKRFTGPVEYAIDGKDETAWGIDAGPGRRNVPRNAVFIPEKPLENPEGMILHFHLKQNHGGWNSDDHMNNNLGRFRLSVTDQENPSADLVPAHVRKILELPKDKRTEEQTLAVFRYWITTLPETKEATQKIEALWQQWPQGSTSLTLQAREEPRNTAVLKRGDFLKPTKQVDVGVPSVLHPLKWTKGEPNRLAFAKWVADRNSPTTARVFVNRVWQSYFGTGLVSTSEDLGVQSDKPSHPELFDWLACEFMDKGWSVKQLHRLIVHSSTYQQSSKVSADLLAKDPYNRLLARAPRLRVEGEVVRDIALSVSGLLNPKVGGESLFSPAPAFLFQPPASYGPFNWIEVSGEDRYRRAIYTFRRRSTPFPMLQNFDAPNGDTACVRRVRSNTPLQALTTLNETIFVEAARAFAQRILKEGGKTEEDRLTFAFRTAVGRTPSAEEKRTLLHLMEKQKQRIADGWVNAIELATGDKELKIKLPEGTTPTQLACYTVISRVLLNLDETITKE